MNSTRLWVFGYGSLMWNPGFQVADHQIARLTGYYRCFCMRSIHHRGTPEAPGLVLALDARPGSFCDGVALAVPAGDEAAVLAMLRERELISSAYLEQVLPVTLADDTTVQAVSFVVDADHVQYCGGLALEEQAQIIAAATGGRGTNRDYLYNTAGHLTDLGIADADLGWLADRVRVLAGGQS